MILVNFENQHFMNSLVLESKKSELGKKLCLLKSGWMPWIDFCVEKIDMNLLWKCSRLIGGSSSSSSISYIPLFTGLIYPRWCRISSINGSTSYFGMIPHNCWSIWVNQKQHSNVFLVVAWQHEPPCKTVARVHKPHAVVLFWEDWYLGVNPKVSKYDVNMTINVCSL